MTGSAGRSAARKYQRGFTCPPVEGGVVREAVVFNDLLGKLLSGNSVPVPRKHAAADRDCMSLWLGERKGWPPSRHDKRLWYLVGFFFAWMWEASPLFRGLKSFASRSGFKAK